MALEKYFAVDNALKGVDSPVRVFGRTGGLSVEARGLPELRGGLNFRLHMNIYTAPVADVKPEAAKLNEVLGALIDQIGTPIKPENIRPFAGGTTKIGSRITYANLQLGGIDLYEELRDGVTLTPSLDFAGDEVKVFLSSFKPAKLTFQSGILVHVMPSVELARIRFLVDKGDPSVVFLQRHRDWTKLSGDEVQRLDEGKPIYDRIKLPRQDESTD